MTITPTALGSRAIHSEVSEVVIVEHQGREINAFYRELGWNGI
jgi:hypothetical protein